VRKRIRKSSEDEETINIPDISQGEDADNELNLR
jgi:hypothetical protein